MESYTSSQTISKHRFDVIEKLKLTESLPNANGLPFANFRSLRIRST